ncbi:MAG: selenocysteine-specific translation elongation factor [bacterium]
MSTDRFVLGSAGHIDHGKTALVRALTGVDTDRLKEEKARGITIELGFASLTSGSTTVGIVDVPGHERFIRAMAAGAAGVDAVMMVIAADEGVMPQTREHLAVCSLLGVRVGFVALNKVDLVDDPEWLELVQSDVQAAVEGTFLEDPVIVRCSASTGEGMDEVRARIFELARSVPERQADGLLRLPMDRVFTMHGFGTVVTGTLIAGTVRVGDDLLAAPTDTGGKVRGIQVHGNEVEEAWAGQRTAVNLKGPDRDELARGLVLTRAGEITPTRRFDAQLQLLEWVDNPIKRGQRYIVLQGTTQAQGKLIPLGAETIEPGETAWAQVDLDRPLVLLPGDRFVLQGFALSKDHGSTIGGGLVVRSHPPRRRKRDDEYASFVERLAMSEPLERLALEVESAGMGGITLQRLTERVPYPPAQTARLLGKLVSEGQLTRFDADAQAVVHGRPFELLGARIVGVVDELASASPMADGFGRQEIFSRLGADIPPRLFRLVVDKLVRKGRLEGDPDSVAPTGSADRMALRELADRVRQTIEDAGYEPPKAGALARQLGVAESDVRDLLASHIKGGRLVRAKDDFVFGALTIERLKGQLVAYLREHGEISPTEFKELCGVTRKYLIPLSELFDEQKVTLRIGNVRKLRE